MDKQQVVPNPLQKTNENFPNMPTMQNPSFKYDGAGSRSIIKNKTANISSSLSAAGQAMMGATRGQSSSAQMQELPNPTDQGLQKEMAEFIDIDDIAHKSMIKNDHDRVPRKQGRMFQLNLGQDVSTTTNEF